MYVWVENFQRPKFFLKRHDLQETSLRGKQVNKRQKKIIAEKKNP
jgi:hypothetical protein